MKKRRLLLFVFAAFSFTTATMAQVPNYVPTNGLVGWWPFNGNANDESGNGNNGTVNGASLISDRFGIADRAYSFDGVDDFIESSVSNLPLNNSPRSISIWTYFSPINTNENSIFSYGTGIGTADARKLYDFFIKDGSPQTYINNNELGSIGLNLSAFNNIWNNFILVYDGSNINSGYSLYANGVPQTVNSFNYTNFNDLITTSSNLFFGKTSMSYSGQNFFYSGKLDDIGIWNRALTQQEITDLYNGCQLSVNSQPINQTININNNAQFIVGSSDPSATYQWQADLGVGFQNLNSVGQYNGTTNDTLTISNVTMSNNNKPFRCIVTSGSCTDTSDIAVLTVNNNVGINETLKGNLFSVFPNPTQSFINVKADNKLIGQVYSIYDNTGRVVLTGKLNSENTTIELSILSGGIYMFSVGENMKQTFKVIKE